MKRSLIVVAVALAILAALSLSAAKDDLKGPPVTFTLFSSDVNANWADMQDELGKYMTDRSGITIKTEFAVGNPSEKINLIAASGDYPDLISPKGDGGILVQAGAMVDLTDLIDKYAPNIKKIMGDQLARLRYSSDDRSIYFIPIIDGMGQIDFDTDAAFKVQLRALAAGKYPAIKTLADYEKVIADYVKKNPTTDGKPTIGLSLLADDWRYCISVTNPAFWATGSSDDGEWYIDPKTYEAKPHYTRPEEREYFRWLNGMYQKGLIDVESFTQKYDQYIAKIASGRVVGLIDANWEIGDAVNALKKDGKFDMTYGRFGPVLKAGMVSAYNTPTGFRGSYGIGITKSCKDPVRVIKFLDWLASEEGQILINWGIKDKHYKVVGGKRVIPDAVKKMKDDDNNTFKRTTGIGNYFLSLRYGDGVKDSTGNYFTTTFPERIVDSYSAPEKAALKAYGKSLWGDLLPPASAFKAKPWAAAWSIQIPSTDEFAPLNNTFNILQAVAKKYLPKAIMGTSADFDKTYDAFLAELKTVADPLAPLETKLVQDRLKLWGVLK